MRLLLDTHAVLWFFEGNNSLSAAARDAMEDETNERYISHATAWEVAIKVSIGKLKIDVPYEDLFPGGLLANGFVTLVPDFRHYRMLLGLPHHHGDPFDRLIIAQSKAENLTLVTCDPNFPAYGIPILW